MPLRSQWVLVSFAVGVLAAAPSSAQTRAGQRLRRDRARPAPNPPRARTIRASVADPGELAFEQHRWQDAIDEYRKLLAASPEDRLSLLRIAQAQRELRKYNDALATLEQARTANAPEAMVDLERARNLALLGRKDDALDALDASDHNGLRALELVETRARVRLVPRLAAASSACTVTSARACSRARPSRMRSDFDFWVGRWEVRSRTARSSARTRSRSATAVARFDEHYDGAGGSSGTSLTFYLPSRGEWRQVWTGSGGTLFDLTGKLVDGSHEDGGPGRVRRGQPRGRVSRHVDAGRRRTRAPATRGVRSRRADLDRLVRRLLPPDRRAEEVALAGQASAERRLSGCAVR